MHEPLEMTQAKAEDSPMTGSEARSSSKVLAMVTIALSNISVSLAATMWAPFFPQEAAAKGVSETVTGFLFGATQLTIFITSPAYGNLVSKVGPRYQCLSGLFICTTCNFLLGTLNRCPDSISFTIMCFLCSTVDANGAAMLTTTSYSVVSASFPTRINQALGILETCLGAASLIGPVFGGFLYTVGGYQLPFFVVGGLLALSLVLSYFFFPSIECHEKKGSFLSLLKTPGAIVGFLAVTSVTLALTFLEPILSSRLLLIKPTISATVIGAVYMVESTMYSLSAPVAGWLCDKGYVKSLMLFGSTITAIGLLLVGPSHILPFLPRDFWLTSASVAILGLGMGISWLPQYQLILSSALKIGLTDNIATYGMAAGLFNSGWGLGAFIGPSLAGLMNEKLGFEWATTLCAIQCIAIAIVIAVYMLVDRLRLGKQSALKGSKTNLNSSTPENSFEEMKSLLPSASTEHKETTILRATDATWNTSDENHAEETQVTPRAFVRE